MSPSFRGVKHFHAPVTVLAVDLGRALVSPHPLQPTALKSSCETAQPTNPLNLNMAGPKHPALVHPTVFPFHPHLSLSSHGLGCPGFSA
jgi:hypothetical protein